MRAAIDLDLFGDHVRVLSDVPEVVDAIQSALSQHVVGRPGPVGFAVRGPERQGGFYCLVDRAGFILARCRTRSGVAAVLIEHLAAFAPAPHGTTRVRLRAVVDEDRGATLLGFPLLATPPVVERRLERQSQRVLDRLVVDLDRGLCLNMTPKPWRLPDETVPRGHASWAHAEVPVDAVLLPARSASDASFADNVAAIAALVSASQERALDLAEALAGRTRLIPTNDSASLYLALRH